MRKQSWPNALFLCTKSQSQNPETLSALLTETHYMAKRVKSARMRDFLKRTD